MTMGIWYIYSDVVNLKKRFTYSATNNSIDKIQINRRIKMKKISITFLIIVMLFLMIWLCSLAKCEVLSSLHSHEFYGLDESATELLPKSENVKVLKYSDDYSEVYFYSDLIGTHFYFEKENNQWNMITYECVWTKMGGNADEVIWPYWWH